MTDVFLYGGEAAPNDVKLRTATIADANAMGGTATVTFTAAGSMSASALISGSSDPAFTTAGNLGGAGALAGAATVTFSPAATLAATGALTGATSPAFTASGALAGAGALSGASAVTFAPAGALAGSGALAGIITVAFTSAGESGGFGALTGTANVAFTASGTMDAGAATVVHLHGRKLPNKPRGKLRGKRIIFPDELPVELPPIVVESTTVDPADKQADARLEQEIAGLRLAVDQLAQRKADKAAKLAAEQAAAEAAVLAEAAAWQARLRDDDEFLLLAA